MESVSFEDRQRAYEKLRSQLLDAGNTDLAAALTAGDLPESFRLKLREGASWRTMADTVRDLRGVATVVNQQCVREQRGSTLTHCATS